MALYRTCPRCGTDYKVSRPACPACGAPPLSRRAAWAATGPRMLALSGFLFFLVWAVYSLALPADRYERYRLYFFGVPRTASRVVGVVGAAAFLALAWRLFSGRRTGPDGSDRPAPPSRDGGGRPPDGP